MCLLDVELAVSQNALYGERYNSHLLVRKPVRALKAVVVQHDSNTINNRAVTCYLWQHMITWHLLERSCVHFTRLQYEVFVVKESGGSVIKHDCCGQQMLFAWLFAKNFTQSIRVGAILQ